MRKGKETEEGEHSLAIKEELMQERGLVLQKTTDPTVPRNKSAIDQAKPSAKNRGPSKSLSVPSGSNETNPGSTRTLSTVVTVSTKSKNGTTAPMGPPVMLHSGKTVGKAIASTPNRIEHVPGENH